MVTQNPRHRINQHAKPNLEAWRDGAAEWIKTAADAVAAEAIRAAFSEAAA